MITPSALRRLSIVGTDAQKRAIGEYHTTQRELQNEAGNRALDARDETQALWDRRAGAMPAGGAPGGMLPAPRRGGGYLPRPPAKEFGGMPALGYAPTPRHKIMGGISGQLGPNERQSGLDDHYAQQAMGIGNVDARNAAVDNLQAQGVASGFGGQLLKDGRPYVPDDFDPLSGADTFGAAVDKEDERMKRFRRGGHLPRNYTGRVADGGEGEFAVPHDGSTPVYLPQVEGAPEGYEFTPNKDVTIIPASVVKRLPQLAKDGITPLGNGDMVMENKYGRGFATHQPRPEGTAPYMIEPQTGVQIMPVQTPRRRMTLMPVPDVVPAGAPFHNPAGMVGDPSLVRKVIDASFKNAAPMIKAVRGLDPEALKAEMYLNDPNSRVVEMAPRRRPSIMPTENLPNTENSFGMAAKARAAADAITGGGGRGPGGLFTPRQMQRAGQEMQRMGNTRTGREKLGEWQMNQPDSSVTSVPVPGAGGGRIPMVGGKPYYGAMIPGEQGGAGQANGVQVLEAEDGTKFYLHNGKIISPGSAVGPDGRPLAKGAEHEEMDWAYLEQVDPITKKVTYSKPERMPKGKKLPPGWVRMQDENNDGVPDAVQPAAAVSAKPGTGAGWRDWLKNQK